MQCIEFLRNVGWEGAHLIPVGEDWSQRKFFRVEKDGKTAILMHSVPDDDPRMSPGHRLRDFVRISEYLDKIGFSVPQVIAHNLPHGILLVEDFGSSIFSELIMRDPEKERDMYLLATHTLMHLYHQTDHANIDLPNYYDSHIHKGHRRVVDWYMPAVLHRQNSDPLVQQYLDVWTKIEKQLPPVKTCVLHGDFHAGNLMWLPERHHIKQAGIIDFQQAMIGPSPYDLVNLLEDARREVPVKLRQECLLMFVSNMKNEERESFLAWYPVLATQFHCRVIGQAIRLAVREKKTRLLSVIPVLRRHLIRDLHSSILHPLRDWFIEQEIDFSTKTPVEIDKIKQFIRPDAV